MPASSSRPAALPDRLSPYGSPELALQLAAYGPARPTSGGGPPHQDRAGGALRWVLSRIDASNRRRQLVEDERQEFDQLVRTGPGLPEGNGNATVLAWGLNASTPPATAATDGEVPRSDRVLTA